MKINLEEFGKGTLAVFCKTYLLKRSFLQMLIVLSLYFPVLQGYCYAEGQTRYSWDFFDSVEPVRLKDPLAIVLGAVDKEAVLVFTYADAVKLAGHSCPAVAGAYKSTQTALKYLYGNEIPVRGNIKVTFKGDVDYQVNGPISQVVTFITGASGENGFKGFGPAGKYRRQNLMVFDGGQLPDPGAICSILFQREDNGRKVEITYSIEPVPSNVRIDKLMPLVISGKASVEESLEFSNLWQERVKTILVNPPEGTFLVNEISE
ncbi:MAG: FmdE family protein [Candidatus Loosdrechtia sp.]|uniref:FmdE family protein n=1 Tax=Candidatus Loosdrechtia sp. TaxID=3101272 RepID=UPI003A67CBED|nr:MAG: FmdE family protein [Candidatus Jettenia sp. AMX2]